MKYLRNFALALIVLLAVAACPLGTNRRVIGPGEMTPGWKPFNPYLFAQGLGPGPDVNAHAIFLDGHAYTDNGSNSRNTVVVALTPGHAGDTITCEWKINSATTYAGIGDNVNSGNYFPILSGIKYASAGAVMGISEMENAAPQTTTITLTSAAAYAKQAMLCQAWMGTPTKYTWDGTFQQGQTGNGANAATGSKVTPFNANELILASLVTKLNLSPRVGSGYSLIDSATTSYLYGEDQVEITPTPGRTAANGPWTNSSGYYIDGMTALGPNVRGFCDSNMVSAWDAAGATNGTAITTALLNQSTHGNGYQPNATGLNDKPGNWQVGGTLTMGDNFTSGSYAPFATLLGCPFYTGAAAGGNQVGLNFVTAPKPPHGVLIYFDTWSTSVSAALCFQTDYPPGNGGSIDSFSLHTLAGGGSGEYTNMTINSDRRNLWMGIETSSGNTQHGLRISPNTSYWVEEHLNAYPGAVEYIKAYSGCSANPALLATLSITSTKSPPFARPTFVHLGVGGNQSSGNGVNLKYGALKVDFQYGGTLLP